MALPPIKESELITQLLTGAHGLSKHFLENIRKYNNAFAFASMGAQIRPPGGHGPYCFRVHGQVYHQTGALHPKAGERRQFAQIYILDPEEQTNQRLGILANTGCRPEIGDELGQFFNLNNRFAKSYKMMRDVELEFALAEGRELRDINMSIVTGRGDDKRRYNAPRVNKVAIIFCSADGEPPQHRDIRVTNKSTNLTERIHDQFYQAVHDLAPPFKQGSL